MSGELDKDMLDRLCATDPIWIGALQLIQLAKRQTADSKAEASVQLMCAIVLLAAETQNPRALIEQCAKGLLRTPLEDDR